jgi:hypothetical protein
MTVLVSGCPKRIVYLPFDPEIRATDLWRSRAHKLGVGNDRNQRLCEVLNYVKMLPVHQLFQALEAIIASHSFPTLRCLELARQRA